MKNLNRNLKAFKKRAAETSAKKMEMLAAAFLKETGLQPSQARFCQATAMEQGKPIMQMWFEPLPERANIADAHPDVQFMADLLFSIHEFSRDKPVASWTPEQQEEVQGWLEMVADHVKKYTDQSTTPVLGASDDRSEATDQKEAEPAR